MRSKKLKRYHPFVFTLLGLAMLAVGLTAGSVRALSILRLYGVTAGISFIVYGLLDFLMDRLADSRLRTVVAVVRRCAQVGFMLLVLSFVAVQALIYSGSASDSGPSADVLIVLGATVEGDQPAYQLKSRLDAAAAVLLENPGTAAILSGGQGEDETVSEAEAMRRYLEEKGVSGDRLILEDQSRNTAENIRFSKQYLEEGQSVTLVTNEFHAYRSRRLARINGVSATVLSVPMDSVVYWTVASLREYISIVLMFLGRT